jgi:SAM-dependent methyltransferase
VYRPGYPASFYTVLQAVGIGTPGQDILDLGTGTGVLARTFATQGAHVTGVDIAEAQIIAAQQLAAQDHLDIRFITCAAEEAALPPQSFDIISCGQSWLYFDTHRMIPLVKTWLKPGGKLVLTYLSWLPRKDPIAQASEQLILRYNPHWSEPISQGVGPFNMPGPGRIFVWSPIMPMRKVFRSHAKAGGGEFAPVGALEQLCLPMRWHASIRSMTHCSNRLLQIRLPFRIRSGSMRIRLLEMLTWCRHHRHKTRV